MGRTTETLCPFFQPGLVEHVTYCLSTPTIKQLDELDTPGRSVPFCECLYPHMDGSQFSSSNFILVFQRVMRPALGSKIAFANLRPLLSI